MFVNGFPTAGKNQNSFKEYHIGKMVSRNSKVQEEVRSFPASNRMAMLRQAKTSEENFSIDDSLASKRSLIHPGNRASSNRNY